ncbi:MAG: endonuclease domain-containing protein [Candidatus Zambryskibacteria bacterium]
MDSKFLYNNKALKERRRELRNNQTPAEKILWKYVSKNKIKRLRFLRQYGIGPYVLDFYCPKIRLGIELDGSVHKEKENKLYDKDREKFLENLNIEVIRFWNSDVLNNTENVLDKLLNKIEQMSNK